MFQQLWLLDAHQAAVMGGLHGCGGGGGGGGVEVVPRGCSPAPKPAAKLSLQLPGLRANPPSAGRALKGSGLAAGALEWQATS